MAGAKAEISLQSGLRYLPGRLSRPEQEDLVEIIRQVVAEAPDDAIERRSRFKAHQPAEPAHDADVTRREYVEAPQATQ